MTNPIQIKLTKMLQQLRPDQLLDVSGLSSDGTGAKTIVAPKDPKRAAKRGVAGLAMVSNNYASYKLATDFLGPQYAPQAAAYLQTYTLSQMGSVPVSPAPIPVTTPYLQPGSALLSNTSMLMPTGTPSVLPVASPGRLPKMLHDLPAGKLLDVSGFDSRGTGAKTIELKNPSNSAKKSASGLPQVVSNNYASYKLAMDALGPSYARYSQQFLSQYGSVAGSVSRPSPGATLTSMAPVFVQPAPPPLSRPGALLTPAAPGLRPGALLTSAAPGLRPGALLQQAPQLSRPGSMLPPLISSTSVAMPPRMSTPPPLLTGSRSGSPPALPPRAGTPPPLTSSRGSATLSRSGSLSRSGTVSQLAPLPPLAASPRLSGSRTMMPSAQLPVPRASSPTSRPQLQVMTSNYPVINQAASTSNLRRGTYTIPTLQE